MKKLSERYEESARHDRRALELASKITVADVNYGSPEIINEVGRHNYLLYLLDIVFEMQDLEDAMSRDEG